METADPSDIQSRVRVLPYTLESTDSESPLPQAPTCRTSSDKSVVVRTARSSARCEHLLRVFCIGGNSVIVQYEYCIVYVAASQVSSERGREKSIGSNVCVEGRNQVCASGLRQSGAW